MHGSLLWENMFWIVLSGNECKYLVTCYSNIKFTSGLNIDCISGPTHRQRRRHRTDWEDCPVACLGIGAQQPPRQSSSAIRHHQTGSRWVPEKINEEKIWRQTWRRSDGDCAEHSDCRSTGIVAEKISSARSLSKKKMNIGVTFKNTEWCITQPCVINYQNSCSNEIKKVNNSPCWTFLCVQNLLLSDVTAFNNVKFAAVTTKTSKYTEPFIKDKFSFRSLKREIKRTLHRKLWLVSWSHFNYLGLYFNRL